MSLPGVGDIITVSSIAAQVYTAYKDAPDVYKHISGEFEALQNLIDKAAQYFKGTTLDGKDLRDGQQILKSCESVLQDLNSLIKKYTDLSSTNKRFSFKRAKLGKEDITTLRARLISNATLLSGFVRRFAIQLSNFSNTIDIDCSTEVVNILKCKHG